MNPTRILARPYHHNNEFPWRPMDNHEKRAAWAVRYYMDYTPHGHKCNDKIEITIKDTPSS